MLVMVHESETRRREHQQPYSHEQQDQRQGTQCRPGNQARTVSGTFSALSRRTSGPGKRDDQQEEPEQDRGYYVPRQPSRPCSSYRGSCRLRKRGHRRSRPGAQGRQPQLPAPCSSLLGPLHGFGIKCRIEQISGELLTVNQGTLYPVLLKLEQAISFTV